MWGADQVGFFPEQLHQLPLYLASPAVRLIVPPYEKKCEEPRHVVHRPGEGEIDQKQIEQDNVQGSPRGNPNGFRGDKPHPEMPVFRKGGIDKSPGVKSAEKNGQAEKIREIVLGGGVRPQVIVGNPLDHDPDASQKTADKGHKAHQKDNVVECLSGENWRVARYGKAEDHGQGGKERKDVEADDQDETDMPRVEGQPIAFAPLEVFSEGKILLEEKQDAPEPCLSATSLDPVQVLEVRPSVAVLLFVYDGVELPPQVSGQMKDTLPLSRCTLQ